MQVKTAGRAVDSPAAAWRREISPFPSDGKAAAIRVSQDQRVDPGNASGLQHGKALASTRMERMPNLGPT